MCQKCAVLYTQGGKNSTPKGDLMSSKHSKFNQLDIQISLVPQADPATKFHLKFGKFGYSSKFRSWVYLFGETDCKVRDPWDFKHWLYITFLSELKYLIFQKRPDWQRLLGRTRCAPSWAAWTTIEMASHGFAARELWFPAEQWTILAHVTSVFLSLDIQSMWVSRT